MATAAQPPRRSGRSIGAVLLGFAVVFVLSLGTEQVLHVLQVYPPRGVPMVDAGLLLLATGYRIVYGIFGSYLMARFAPHSPLRHALIGGAIGTVLSLGGVVATLTQPNLGPLWYPIAIVVTALPCAWVGAQIHLRRQHAA